MTLRRPTVNLRETCRVLKVSKFQILHGREHSIQWLARELSISRLNLAGLLLGDRAPAVEAKKTFAVAETLEAWTARLEGEESRTDRRVTCVEINERRSNVKGSQHLS